MSSLFPGETLNICLFSHDDTFVFFFPIITCVFLKWEKKGDVRDSSSQHFCRQHMATFRSHVYTRVLPLLFQLTRLSVRSIEQDQ